VSVCSALLIVKVFSLLLYLYVFFSTFLVNKDDQNVAAFTEDSGLLMMQLSTGHESSHAYGEMSFASASPQDWNSLPSV